ERTEDVRPLLGEGVRGVAFEPVAADRAEDGAEQIAPSANSAPDDGFEGFVGGHLTGVDDADLRDVERAAQSRDDGSEDEDEQLELRRRVAGEQDAVLRIADGALNKAEFRRGQPAAKK